MDTQTEAESNAIMARCYRHASPIPIRTFDVIDSGCRQSAISA
jgi:hypothetical protein